MSRQRKNKRQSRQSKSRRSRQFRSIPELQLLEPRLFLSTTVMYQQGGTGGYTPATFDCTQLNQGGDTPLNSWMQTISTTKYDPIAVKDLFTLLLPTVGGNPINITSAQLILHRYNTGSSSDTIYVDRMTSNWLPNAAGSNSANVTWKHESLSPSQFWAGGGDISTSDYTTTHEGSAPFVNSGDAPIDITALMQDIYSTGINDGFLIRSSNTGTGDNYFSPTYGSNEPVLSITYDYGSTVTLAATTPNAYEPNPNGNGVFTVTRTGSTSSALPVNYTIGGTGINGSDYTTLSGSVTIPSGQSSTTITVAPINDTIADTDKTVALSLASGSGYSIGGQNSGTVTIFDNASTTMKLRNVAGTGYTQATFDDTQLNVGGDTSGVSWETVLGVSKFGLMAVKGLFTSLPRTDVNGNNITITSASLILTRYNAGSTSDTITVDRVTSNWLPAAAGSNQNNVTDVHETLPSQVWPGTGYGRFDWQNYTTTDQGSAPFVSSGACTIDITALMRDIYSTGTNYGFAIFTSATGTNTDNYYTSGYTSGQPVLQISYTYGSTVDIAATQSSAAEPSVPGTYTVTRSGPTSNAMTVNYTVSGTATNGTDYNTLPGTVTIPSGQTSATITLTPKGTSFSGSKTAILTLAPGAYTAICNPPNPSPNATVNIAGTAGYGITGISGTVNVNQPITITGNGFGSGPSDVVFDNFEAGVAGAPINFGPGSADVGIWNFAQNAVTYSTDSSISGKQAFKADMSTNGGNDVYHDYAGGTSQIFSTWWVQMPSVWPGLGNNNNWKHVWILGTNRSTAIDDMFLVFACDAGSSDPNTVQFYIGHNCPGGSTVYPGWKVGNGDFQSGDWVRMTLSTTGSTTNTGNITVSMLNPRTGRNLTFNANNISTWGGGSPDQWGSIAFNGYNYAAPGSTTLFDDTYSATGPNAVAHVEIGNASTYAACTNLSICPTQSWASGSITALANFGSLNTTGPLYMYVTKADGTISPPYPVTVSQAPLANNDNYSVSMNGVLSVSAAGVLANDVDLQGGTITASRVANASHGSVTVNSNGSFTYTPNSNYSGPDSFTYSVSDGTHTSNTATVSISVRQLMVKFGNAPATDTFNTTWTGWGTEAGVFLAQYVTRAADGNGVGGNNSPGSVYAKVSSGTAQTFIAGQTVYVTWHNDSTSAITFTPQISFDDPDADGSGTGGTWYNLTPVNRPVGAVVEIGPGQSVTSYYTIDAGSAGSHTLINVCMNISNQPNLLLSSIEVC